MSAVDTLPYILSVLTILMMYLVGEKKRSGWLIGLASQAIWLYWIIADQKWGFLILSFYLTYIYYVNYRKWS